LQPNATLYIRNLHEKKTIKSLTLALSSLFKPYGEILDVRVKRNVKARGQAFVIFAEMESATKAKSEVHQFPLFGKPMDIQYARDQSFKTSEREGTLEEHKKRRAEE
ncbi:hypothetical protein BDK51DRAFT_2898, partial [Blyttiomyces helicus]